MKRVLDIRRQLHELCECVGVVISSQGGRSECSESLRRALLNGLFLNVAEHAGEGKYKTVSGTCNKEHSERGQTSTKDNLKVPYTISKGKRQRMGLGTCKLCWHSFGHNRLNLNASIMLA